VPAREQVEKRGGGKRTTALGVSAVKKVMVSCKVSVGSGAASYALLVKPAGEERW
jgi:hypothetical protein